MTELFDHLPGQQQEQPTRRSNRAQQQRSRRGRSTALLAGGLVMTLLAALLGLKVFKPMYDDWRAPKDYAGPGTGTVMFKVQQGQNGARIAANLAKAGVVKTSDAFSAAARKNPRSSAIQPGTYRLKKHMSSAEALTALLSKDARVSIRLQLPEGLRAVDALSRLSKVTGYSVAQFTAAAKTPAVGLPASANGNLEGYLFPATYSLDPTAKPASILKGMVGTYKKAMASAGIPESKQRKVLTLASIVQGESAGTKDMPKIARVFTNRLQQGMPFGSDVTVLYANNAKPSVTTTDAMRANPSPYNTYKHAGLPPGPINSPGVAAIKAAYQPVPGSWLYFVAVNPTTGETRFATTAAEHAKNVALFQKWLRQNGGN